MAAEVKPCSVEICNNQAFVRGYCGAHYARLARHGDPLGGGTSRGATLRFINEVALLHTGEECLPWPFGKNQDGRGRIWIDDKMVLVHRYVCELAHGAPPTPEHEAAHSCGKGHDACISPIHLNWKTKADNEADKLEHGTSNRGERQGQSKLTEDDVREILALKGVEKQRDLAKRFGVVRQTVSSIQTGKIWGWLSDCGSQVVANQEQIR